MKFRSISEFNFPENLSKILEDEGYYEDETFEPITITVQEIQYKGEDMISYQAEFEVLDEYEQIDGDEWEKLIRIYIEEKEPELLEFITGDSESSTCVIWTNKESKFINILNRMIELIENAIEVTRIKKEASR